MSSLRSTARKLSAAMFVAGLMSAIALAACDRSPSQEEPFKLRIGFFPVPDYLPYFVMQERGLDKKEGLQFEERPYSGGAEILRAMASDAVDVGYCGSVPVFSAAERGLVPAAAVAVAANTFADPEHPLLGVLAAPSIHDWKDLEGKHIGVNAIDSINTAAIRGRLRQEGVRNHTLVEVPTANMGLAVASGNIAAGTMVDPFLTQSLLRGDGKLLGWVIGGPPFERMEATMIVVSARLARKSRQAVKAFLSAQLQAVEWIERHPEEARSVLSERLRLSRDVGRKMFLPRWSSDARNDPALLEDMESVLVDVGLLEAPIAAGRLYDETILEEALAARR